MGPLSIHGNLFEPMAEDAAPTAEATSFIMIQTRDSLTMDERALLQQQGAAYERQLADNTYLLYYEPTDLESIRLLEFVQFVDVYHPHLKLSATFEHIGIPKHTLLTGEPVVNTAGPSEALAAAAPAISHTEPIWIAVSLHDNAGRTIEEVTDELAHAGIIFPDTTRIISPIRMDTMVAPADLHKVAAVDAVSMINPYKGKKKKIDITRTLLTDCIYSPDLSTEYTGAGQVICTGESGFDKGVIDDIHPGFRKGSMLAISNVWGPGQPLDDTDNHGTAVCGCINLDTTSASMSGGRRIRGTAPGANLVMIRHENSKGDIWSTSMLPDFLQAPFAGPFAPRVFSHSFNADWDGKREPYDNEAGDIDDWSFHNQEALVCLCAGNEGTPGSTHQIGQETAAKNLLVVGACDTTRPNTNDVYDPKKTTDNDHYVVLPHSNRGPTDEERYKPDLVAPGAAILSALSRHAKDNHADGVSLDPLLLFNTGTSISTPVVAGCAAVIREALVKHPTHAVKNPPGALVKALLINGAVPLNPNTVIPQIDSGFGRVNVSGSLAHLEVPPPSTQPRCGYFPGKIAAKGSMTAAAIKVPAPETIALTGDEVPHRLRVTLVWYDVRGLKTENKLHLKVTKAGGTALQSVCGNKDVAATDGSAQVADENNTTQRVDWVGIPAGDYTADVSCSVTHPSSPSVDFYVAWYLF